MSKRLEYVDIAKGIGIVLVVCSHTDALGLMWLFMGMFVPIFYFCSGYTSSTKGTFKESIWKRFRKLFVPYLFFNLLLFCVFRHFSIRELVGVIYSWYSLYPLDVTPNIKFLTSGNYPMIVTYLLFYFIVYYEHYKKYIICAYVLLTFVFIQCPILLPWSIDTAFLTALFMYEGMEVCKRGWIQMEVWKVLMLLLIYIGIHCIAGDMNLSVRMYGTSVIIYFILGTIGSYLVLWGSSILEHFLIGKFFLVLGQHSLTIFCVQMAFIVWTKDIYQLILPNMPLGYLAGLFEICVALLGGWAVSVLIHHNRFLSRLLL